MAIQAPAKPAPLEPSLLGTKEYWDELYTNELSNHALNPSDVGTIWFDDSSAEDKVLAFLHSPKLGLDLDTTKFLDLGTGNGHFLFRLRNPWPPEVGSDDDDVVDDSDDQGGDVEEEESEKEAARAEAQPDNDGVDRIEYIEKEGPKVKNKNKNKKTTAGFKGPMVGADYSLPSITFARQVASSLGHDITYPSASPSLRPRRESFIAFVHHDILYSPASELLLPLRRYPTTHYLDDDDDDDDGREDERGKEQEEEGYDVILDKGTFDAISLSSSFPTFPSAVRIEETYAAKILPLLKRSGLFIITSCNWTTEEIRSWFEGRGFRFVHEVRYPSFNFGGSKGQAVCSVCFRKGG